MDVRNENNNVFNIKLAKLMGLYQILDPRTVKYRCQNIYHIVIVCILLYTSIVLTILILSCLYYWTVNKPLTMDYFWKGECVSFIMYKTWFIVHHSNDIWNCLSIVRYDFTAFSNRNKRVVLDRWRERLVRFTTVYVILYVAGTTSYVVITLAFSDIKLPIKNHDGSIGHYRQNAMNFYLIASDETYNTHYHKFYFVEAVFIHLMTTLFIIFDILLVSLCFGMCCQIQIICSAFESLGHQSLRDQRLGVDSTDKNKPFNEHDLIYDELKTIIMDHQAVMKKYEEFLTLFRRVILIHILGSSLMIIVLWVTFIMGFSNDERFNTLDVIEKKLLCSIPSILFQLFMVYYLFGNIHDQKNSIIFSLYSSNWTEMNMKCKKLVLLTMKLNNTNHKQLKFTRTKIVNQEMFFKTMGNCYTIISVLLNYIRKDE